MLERRVVVTGMGVVSPAGRSIDEFWKNLVDGKSFVREDVSDVIPELKDYPIKSGALFLPGEYTFNVESIDKKDARRMGKFSQYAVDAAYQAIKDAQLAGCVDRIKERTSVFIGTGIGGLREIEEQKTKGIKKGIKKIHPLVIPIVIPDAAASNVSRLFGFYGESLSAETACATGNTNICLGYDKIKLNQADVTIVGGTGAASSMTYAGFGNAGALSKTGVARPFDAERDGFVIGEGAGVLVLEELEHAKKRGANIYAKVLGHGSTSDGFALTAPREDAKYSSLAMKKAVENSELNLDEIKHINAHGTGTLLNDKTETLAIKKTFGDLAYKILITSNKASIGHTLGAAGGIEAIATIKTIYEGIIPPTINFEARDLECDLNYVFNEARKEKIDYALSNVSGFGGHNCAVAFGRFEDSKA